MKAIIPVAGLGTRMLPATKAIPKELLPVYDRPIIQHVVEEAIAAGITDIILVTRSGKEAIENHFDAHYELEHRLEKKGNQLTLGKIKNTIPDNVQIISIRQPDAKGLGDAILCAKNLIGTDDHFAVLLPDVLLLDKPNKPLHSSFAECVSLVKRTGICQIMVKQVPPDQVDQYGIVELQDKTLAMSKNNPAELIKSLVEKPQKGKAPSNLAVIGRYILPNKLMSILATVPVGVGGEVQLTDGLSQLLQEQPLAAFETEADVFDCGEKMGFVKANVAVAERSGVKW